MKLKSITRRGNKYHLQRFSTRHNEMTFRLFEYIKVKGEYTVFNETKSKSEPGTRTTSKIEEYFSDGTWIKID